jgi:hypothetical protein
VASIFSTTGSIRTEKDSALAWIQPRRSTTSSGASWFWATRPVKSRTSPVDLAAPSRNCATTAVASAALTSGPSPAIRAPTSTAVDQSINSLMVRD